MRTLLTLVKGATSFDDLYTHNGVHYDSFRDACIARGLLEDDGEWRLCLQEASVMQSGTRLRHLFCTILPLKSNLHHIFYIPGLRSAFDFGLIVVIHICAVIHLF